MDGRGVAKRRLRDGRAEEEAGGRRVPGTGAAESGGAGEGEEEGRGPAEELVRGQREASEGREAAPYLVEAEQNLRVSPADAAASVGLAAGAAGALADDRIGGVRDSRPAGEDAETDPEVLAEEADEEFVDEGAADGEARPGRRDRRPRLRLEAAERVLVRGVEAFGRRALRDEAGDDGADRGVGRIEKGRGQRAERPGVHPDVGVGEDDDLAAAPAKGLGEGRGLSHPGEPEGVDERVGAVGRAVRNEEDAEPVARVVLPLEVELLLDDRLPLVVEDADDVEGGKIGIGRMRAGGGRTDGRGGSGTRGRAPGAASGGECGKRGEEGGIDSVGVGDGRGEKGGDHGIDSAGEFTPSSCARRAPPVNEAPRYTRGVMGSVPRVALVAPPFLPRYSRASRSPAVARSGTIYFPILLAYGAAGLEEAGCEVLLLDAVARGLDRAAALAAVAAFRPDAVAVDVATPSAGSDADFAAAVAATGVPTAAVGPGAAASAPLPDGVARVRSDLDEALPGWVEALGRGERPSEVDRPARRLDRRPWASEIYRRHLRPADYFYACARHPLVAVLASRGCPFGCLFCQWPATVTGTRVRTRAVEDVADELAFVGREMSEVREVFFEDDTFNLDPRRVEAFCGEILRRGLRTRWSCNWRPDSATNGLLPLMRRAGCRLLLAGYESGDEAALARLGKRTSVEGMRAFASAARRAGLLVHGCFVLGLPGEAAESTERTVALALALDPDTAQFYPYMPYAWTPGARAEPADSAWLTPDGRHAGLGGAGLDAAGLTAACDAARRRFYLRPRYLARKVLQSLRPAEFRRNAAAARRFLGPLLGLGSAAA